MKGEHKEQKVKLFRTAEGCVIEEDNEYYRLGGIPIDFLLAREDLPEYLSEFIQTITPSSELGQA